VLESQDPPYSGQPSADATAVACRALAVVHSALDELLDALANDSLATSVVLQVTEDIGRAVNKVRAAHTAAIGQARASGMWAIDGYSTSTSWLRDTHRLDGGRARALELTATWLDEHPRTRDAHQRGEVTAEHIAAIRRVTAAHPQRARAYPLFEEELLKVAANSDPMVTLAVLKAWADAIDPSPGDEESEKSHENRSFFLSPVGDHWDLRGTLPSAQGAELAGILNEIMAARRRDSADFALDPPAARRADALMDLARGAADAMTTRPGDQAGKGLLGPGARSRARVIVTVPLLRITDPNSETATSSATTPDCDPETAALADHETGTLADPGLSLTESMSDPMMVAATWRCGNGPGSGFLAMREVLRLSCDAEVQRLVVDSDSQPLDIGRATRVVPPAMRTALEMRDRGCIMPGCHRPPSWCEAHHIQHWSAGGSTSLPNLVLLCSRHHHELHNDKWSLAISDNGRPIAKRRRSSPVRRR